ncbi:MAG TPA: Npt1/Npt2 family nucleotide transporter [Vicinamibacteria bacterium]|nr:Npt1/Npt2 family nucleotide transporter [Vicinamibacteria bacterium]
MARLAMLGTLERLLRLQRGDLYRGLPLFAYLFLVIAAYLVGQVARNALFLDRFAASQLPFVDVSLFLLVAVTVALYLRAGRRWGLESLLVGSLLLFGSTSLLLAVLAYRASPSWLYPVVYLWVGVFGVVAPAQVWTLASYVVTPREARRLFGFVGTGATLGATAAGFLSSALARIFGAESLLVLMSVLLLAAVPLVPMLWRRRPQPAATERGKETRGASGGGLRRSLRLVLGSAHLRTIAGVVVLSSFVTAVCGWQFKAMAQQSVAGKDALAAFFGMFDAWVGLGCVGFQLLFTAGLLRRLGLGATLVLLPLGLLAGSAGFLVFGTLASAILLRGADKVFRYSIDRPAVELLYLPVPPALKLPAKSFIDTVAWRAGDGLAGLAVMAFATAGGLSPVQLALVNMPFIAAWIVLAARAHRRYVVTLGESLRQHRLDAERASTAVLDRETTEMLTSRLAAVDPREILYALDLLALGRPGRAAHPSVRGLLGHEDAEVRRRALAILNEAGDRSVVPQAEALLHDPQLEVRTEALLYLSRHADVDPVARLRDLGDYPDFSVRAAVVAVLARLGEERLEVARLLFEAMVAEEGEGGRRTRLEAARLAERQALPFEGALRRLVADEDPDVARAAIRAAARHGPGPFVDALVARLGEPALQAEAAQALVAAGDAALGPASRTLADLHSAPAVRRALPPVLERIGSDRAAAALAEHLLDGDAGLRLAILVALARMRDERADVEIDPRPLDAALGAEVLGHYRSYQILGQIAAPDSPEPLRQGLRTAMREEVERIFRLLDLLHYRRGFRSAWVALQSGNAIVHDQALDLLESALRPEVKGLLVPLVDPEVSEEQRTRMAHRLVGAPVETPEAAVAALASTGDPWLRSCAAYAIGALGLRALAPHLDAWRDDPDPLLRETVRQARARLAERATSTAPPPAEWRR